MRNVSKSFGGVHALRGVTFEAHAGEVHALCGENGAGKSTLMKILAGAITGYDGAVELELGRQPVTFKGPRDAEDAGIRIIYQELNLVPDLSVAANIFLGPREASPVSAGSTTARWRPRPAASSTASAPRSRLGLAWETCGSATSRWSRSPRRWPSDAEVVIMDEPTSALSDAEVARLFRVIADLRKGRCLSSCTSRTR